MEAPPQYIGVTGFMSPHEIAQLQAMIDPPGPLLMVGLLASAKTLAGQPNKYPGQFPKRENIAELLSAIDPSRAFGLIHYAPYTMDYPNRRAWQENRAQLFNDCSSLIVELGRDLLALPGFAGFQFNMPLPSRPDLYWLAAEVRRTIHRKARNVLEYWPEKWHDLQQMLAAGQSDSERQPPSFVTTLARTYGDRYPFQTLLYDVSGGCGVELEVKQVLRDILPIIEHVHQARGLQLAVGGGLCAERIPLLKPIVESYPQLSIDAQGKLRNPSDDSLDLDAAKRYITVAQELLASADR